MYESVLNEKNEEKSDFDKYFSGLFEGMDPGDKFRFRIGDEEEEDYNFGLYKDEEEMKSDRREKKTRISSHMGASGRARKKNGRRS